MLEELKSEVCAANRELPGSGLVRLTWGNVSGIDRERGIFGIKPSGVDYAELEPEHIVLIDLEGAVVEGELNPSSDTKTHLEFYRAWSGIGGVTHTHSPAATALAQAGRELPCFGTTHADHFYGTVPVCRALDPAEVADDYEKNTGLAIVQSALRGPISSVNAPRTIKVIHIKTANRPIQRQRGVGGWPVGK